MQQLKGPNGDGDSGLPLVYVDIVGGPDASGALSVRVVCYSKATKVARRFSMRVGQWCTLAWKLKVSGGSDGFLLVSVNGDAWQGLRGMPMLRQGTQNYDLKTGLYRKLHPGMDDEVYIEHRGTYRGKVA